MMPDTWLSLLSQGFGSLLSRAASPLPGHDPGNEQVAIRALEPKQFRAGYEPSPDDVFIAIMGMTGSGKSTFISHCTNGKVQIGHDLMACKSVHGFSNSVVTDIL